MPSPPRNGVLSTAELAEKVQAILESKQLTLYRVSRRSAELYGRSSPYFVPHNLYYDLRAGIYLPSIHQITALSRISGYRIRDWLRVFGFDLQDILRLQITLPARRTLLLDTSLTDVKDWVPWFTTRPERASPPGIAPLMMLLHPAPAERIGSLQEPGAPCFLYAKIGQEDALAFPELAPGSIVRVHPELVDGSLLRKNTPSSDCYFLVEHSKGIFCCRIRIPDNGVIVPFSNGAGYAQVELRYPHQAKLRGTIDLELRPLLRGSEPTVPSDLARRWKPQAFPESENIGQLLKRARKSMNLSVRDAARVSHTVAAFLNDPRYETSPSSLNDYELHNSAPRDFHKIITLCSIYGLAFETVMAHMSIKLSDAGSEAMPDRFVSRAVPERTLSSAGPGFVGARFLDRLLEQVGEVPFFVRHTLGYFYGGSRVSSEDFFWIGGDDDPLHPYLTEALLVLVNRHRKTPVYFVSKPLWEQPIYVLLKRDGNYVAACCGLEDGKLIVHPHAREFHRVVEYRNRQDAEVVGQIVAIARRIHH